MEADGTDWKIRRLEDKGHKENDRQEASTAFTVFVPPSKIKPPRARYPYYGH
jgi:hypothetical protein